MLVNPKGDVKAADFRAAQNIIVNSTGRAAVSVIGRSRLRYFRGAALIWARSADWGRGATSDVILVTESLRYLIAV
jgi:hypothetical protein